MARLTSLISSARLEAILSSYYTGEFLLYSAQKASFISLLCIEALAIMISWSNQAKARSVRSEQVGRKHL
jgi:hypothetical protein